MMNGMDLRQGMSTLAFQSQPMGWGGASTQQVDRNRAGEGIVRTHDVYVVQDDVCSTGVR